MISETGVIAASANEAWGRGGERSEGEGDVAPQRRERERESVRWGGKTGQRVRQQKRKTKKERTMSQKESENRLRSFSVEMSD